MTDVTAKTVELQASYSPRRFAITGSSIDQSVLGAIEKAGGRWEPSIMNLMAHTVSADDICLDIGANIGVHTLDMADLVPKGSVYAFEHSSLIFGCLSSNVAPTHLNDIRPFLLALA